MRLLVFIQGLMLNAIWLLCGIIGISIAYYGFQKSVMWGIAGIVVGFVAASTLFTIGKTIHHLLFGIIYSIVMPKELKDALKSRSDL